MHRVMGNRLRRCMRTGAGRKSPEHALSTRRALGDRQRRHMQEENGRMRGRRMNRCKTRTQLSMRRRSKDRRTGKVIYTRRKREKRAQGATRAHQVEESTSNTC